MEPKEKGGLQKGKDISRFVRLACVKMICRRDGPESMSEWVRERGGGTVQVKKCLAYKDA